MNREAGYPMNNIGMKEGEKPNKVSSSDKEELRIFRSKLKEAKDAHAISILIQPLVYAKLGVSLYNEHICLLFRTMCDSPAEDGQLVQDRIAQYVSEGDIDAAVRYAAEALEALLHSKNQDIDLKRKSV